MEVDFERRVGADCAYRRMHTVIAAARTRPTTGRYVPSPTTCVHCRHICVAHAHRGCARLRQYKPDPKPVHTRPTACATSSAASAVHCSSNLHTKTCCIQCGAWAALEQSYRMKRHNHRQQLPQRKQMAPKLLQKHWKHPQQSDHDERNQPHHHHDVQQASSCILLN